MASASTNQASLLLQKQLKGNDPILNLFVKNTVLERIRNFFFFFVLFHLQIFVKIPSMASPPVWSTRAISLNGVSPLLDLPILCSTCSNLFFCFECCVLCYVLGFTLGRIGSRLRLCLLVLIFFLKFWLNWILGNF